MVTIIDDDDGARESLNMLLEYAGFASRSFRFCDEYLASGGPVLGELLVLDVQMPGTDGLELLEILRAKGRRPTCYPGYGASV